MKQTITHTTGITISNDSTNKKMKNQFSNKFIKSILTTVVLALSTTLAFAQSAGFNGSYLILSANAAADTYYDLNAVTANPDFQGSNLGTFVLGANSLTLKGAEHNVYKCGGCNISATSMNYRIYSTSGSAGSFISTNIPYFSGFNNGCGGQDQQWKTTSANIDVLNGLGAGTYFLEVYEMATTTCTNQFLSNGGANYKAQFTLSCPTVTISAGSATSFCSGGSVNLSTTSIAGSTYQWKLSGSNVGSNSETYSATQSGLYSLTVSTALGCVINSNSISVTVYSTPLATISASGSTSLCPGGSVVLSASAVTNAIYDWKLNGTSLVSGLSNTYSANQSGGYTVSVTSTQGCTATSSSPTFVTVNSNPTISVTSSSLESSCGAAVTSTASGAATYLWSNGGTSAIGSFTTAGTYTVTGTSAAGCTGTATVTVSTGSSTTSNAVTVHYHTLPTATISASSATTFCQGGNVVLTSSAGTSYLWSNGATASSITVSTSGSYTVTVTNANGCSATSAATVVTVNSLPSVPVLSGSSFCSNSTGTVSVSSSQMDVTYDLYASGDVIGNTSTDGNSSSLSWTGLSSGIPYMVVATNDVTGCSSTSNSITLSSITAGTYYQDLDGDTYGSTVSALACSVPQGYVQNNLDCNDNNSGIHPGALDVCNNGIDEDCYGGDDLPDFYRSATTSGNWTSLSTWTCSCTSNGTYVAATTLPTDIVNTTILSGHTVTVTTASTSSSPAITGNLTLNGTLLVNGKATVMQGFANNGLLQVNSNAGFSQRSTTSANTGTGNVIIKQNFTGSMGTTSPNGRYWYLGSPVAGSNTSLFLSAGNYNNRLWSYNPANNSWVTVVNSTNGSNSGTSETMTAGKGYLFRTGSTNFEATYSATATQLNNHITTPIQFSGQGYKYVSNPYISHVNWLLTARSGLNNAYWVKTPGNNAYNTYNATTGTGTGGVTNFIPPMQGFFVYVYATTGSLVMNNSHRTHATQTLYAPLADHEVRLTLNDGKSQDEVVVYEHELSSNGLEETDTDKMMVDHSHQLYLLEGSRQLTLDGLADATAKQKVDMGIQITSAGTYTINATELGIEEDVVLEDKFTHAFQDLKLNNTYSFTSNAGTYNNRFVLHFTLNPQTETAIETETVGVTETEEEIDGVSVYTTTGQQVKVWVTNTAEFQNATVKVYDAIGNLVERKNMTSNELSLDLDIASGIYVVEVTGAEKTFTKKVFISK